MRRQLVKGSTWQGCLGEASASEGVHLAGCLDEASASEGVHLARLPG